MLLALALVLVAGAAISSGWWWYTQRQATETVELRASGRLEATEINIASESGGVLATLPVQEGDRVQRGVVLATFDTDLLDQEIKSAPDVATRYHLQLERDRQTLRSPLDGWVVRTNFEPREMVPPGAPVLVVADWRNLTLKVYLPEDQFGRLFVGQSGRIRVDTYRNETFSGTVTSIASDAEFTPRDMQTEEDRVKSVYAIKLRVPNAELRLKPGMFADAEFTLAPAHADTVSNPTQVVSATVLSGGEHQQTLSFSGEIQSREQISVMPKASGRIERVLVDVGSRIKSGDTIAQLDQDTARSQVLQAQAGLAGAQAKLATLQAGPRAEEIAAAEAALSQQRVRLEDMQSGGRAVDIELAQTVLDAQQARLDLMLQGGRAEAIQQAQDAVDAASARLTTVEEGATDDVRQAAQSAVDSDQAALVSAEAAYAALGGANAADLQAARSQADALTAQVKAAQSAVASADAALNNLQRSGPADIQQATSAFDQAQAQLSAAKAALEQANNPTQASIAQAEAAVQQAVAARAAVEAAQGQLDLLQRGGGPGDRAQLDAIRNGGVEAERAQLKALKEAANSELDGAQQSLLVAQARLAAIQSGALDAQVKNANAQVTAARERLKSDQARLDQLVAGPTDEDLRQARATVDQARQQVALATQPWTQQEVRAQRAAVQQARLQLEKAQMPYTQADIQQQQAVVDQAAALFELKKDPYTRHDLDAAQAAVDQAKAQLGLAELGLQDTTVTAPVDGVIAQRLLAPGALVTPQTPIVALVPPALELVADIDDSHLAHVDIGQTVQIQVDAYPGKTFMGSVISAAPIVDPRSRTINLRIQPQDEQHLLRAGMYATGVFGTTTSPR